jgi:branched-chain amino acid transport system ATP-binding protein
VFGRIVRSPAYRADMLQTEREANEIMQRAGLAEYADAVVGTLAYGVQRRVAIGTAMMTDPRLLLLDEPAAGMNDEESAELVSLLRLFAERRTVVVVEHDMTVITALCDRVLALVDGEVVAVGPPDEVLREPAVVTAYLGADDV